MTTSPAALCRAVESAPRRRSLDLEVKAAERDAAYALVTWREADAEVADALKERLDAARAKVDRLRAELEAAA